MGRLLQWQKLLNLSAGQVSVNCCHSHCVFANTGFCFSSLFLASDDLAGVKLMWDLPKVPGEAGCLSLISSWVKGTLASWEISPWCWTLQLGWVGWCVLNEVFFLRFCDYSGVYLCCCCSIVLLKLPKWILGVFWSCFCLWLVIQSLVFAGGQECWDLLQHYYFPKF